MAIAKTKTRKRRAKQLGIAGTDRDRIEELDAAIDGYVESRDDWHEAPYNVKVEPRSNNAIAAGKRRRQTGSRTESRRLS